MKVIERALDGLIVFELRKFHDDRGFFEEFFNLDKFAGAGVDRQFMQLNHSRSNPNVLRGLHYQNDPPQAKLVGVITGRIWDVAVDLRPGSPTRGRHFATELSEENGRHLWIPAGFAHGFYVLGSTPADVIYQVDNPYNPASEAGLAWNDEALAIPWPLRGDPIVSAKDQAQPKFQ